MSVIRRRDKMLSIRLSDEEFRQLKGLCEMRGARSISDLAREAMLQLAAIPRGNTAGSSVISRIDDLDVRLASLQFEVTRLTSQLGASACD